MNDDEDEEMSVLDYAEMPVLERGEGADLTSLSETDDFFNKDFEEKHGDPINLGMQTITKLSGIQKETGADLRDTDAFKAADDEHSQQNNPVVIDLVTTMDLALDAENGIPEKTEDQKLHDAYLWAKATMEEQKKEVRRAELELKSVIETVYSKKASEAAVVQPHEGFSWDKRYNLLQADDRTEMLNGMTDSVSKTLSSVGKTLRSAFWKVMSF